MNETGTEKSVNRAVLVGLDAHSLPPGDGATAATLA